MTSHDATSPDEKQQQLDYLIELFVLGALCSAATCAIPDVLIDAVYAWTQVPGIYLLEGIVAAVVVVMLLLITVEIKCNSRIESYLMGCWTGLALIFYLRYTSKTSVFNMAQLLIQRLNATESN